MARWPFSKPSGAVVGLSVERLSTNFKRLELKHTLTHQAHRFRFELDQSAQLLVKVDSTIAQRKDWYRAGYLATLLRGTPITNPVASVERLYFGQQSLSIVWTGQGYYLEFWPHLWRSDYRIEIWARESLIAGTQTQYAATQDGLLLFQTQDGHPDIFTFLGVPIRFP